MNGQKKPDRQHNQRLQLNSLTGWIGSVVLKFIVKQTNHQTNRNVKMHDICLSVDTTNKTDDEQLK